MKLKIIILTIMCCGALPVRGMEHNNPLYDYSDESKSSGSSSNSPRQQVYKITDEKTGTVLEEYPGLSYFHKGPTEIWVRGKEILRRLLNTELSLPKIQKPTTRIGQQRMPQPTNNYSAQPQEIDTDTVNLTKDQYLEMIVEVLWALYKIASEKKGFLFDKGTIVIHDPELKIFKFLFNYTQQRNDRITGKNDKAYFVTFNPDTTSRASTHFVESQKEHTQYGIDIRFDDPTLQTIFKLPHNHKHVLYGIVSKAKGIIFLKFEGAGTYIADGFIEHAGSLAKSIARSSWYLAKPIVSETVFKKGQEKFGSDNDPNACREKVPKQIVKEFSDIINAYPGIPQKKKEQYIARFKELGLQYAISLSKIPETISPGTEIRFPYDEIKKFAEKYAREIKQESSQETGAVGKWREVVITQQDLTKALNR